MAWRPRHIAGLALFAAVFIAAHGCLLYTHRYVWSEEAVAHVKVRDFACGQSRCDLLLLGNSHMMMGVDPAAFLNAESLTSLGEPYISTYYKMRYALAQRTEMPKAIALQLDLHSFSDQNLSAQTGYRTTMYFDYLANARETGNYWTTFQNWAQYKFAPYAGQSKLLMSYVFGFRETPEDAAKWWTTTTFAQIDDRQYAAYRVATSHLQYRLWNDPEEILYFERIVDFCARHGIQLVWVRIPISSEYYDEAVKLLPLSEWQSLVDTEHKKYAFVHLLDYHDLFFGRPELFADANHLSPAGRAVFSGRLLADMKAMGLASPPGAPASK